MTFRRKVVGQDMVSPNAKKTILFADEDGGLRKLLAGSLARSGYNLIAATGGEDALQKAGGSAGTIHLLLAGVDLPGMTGIELAIQMKRERPGTKILLLSRLDSGMLLLLNDGWQFLPKPFMADMLQNRIRDFLGGQPPPGEHVPEYSEVSEPVAEEARSAKTVLFAEGKGLRQSASISLRTAGYPLIAASSGKEALQKAHEFDGPIHILVATIEMPDMTGIELARRLNRDRPGTKILLVSTLDSGTLVLGHGWHFLAAPFESEMLRTTVRDILTEEPDDARNGLEKLTSRETQVLRLIAAGNSTKQVAGRLGIAFKTAVGHRSSLMKKLGIHDTVTLVRYAIREGFIDP
jgi:DNA-binding NarL/FixJ family response regulator